MTLPNLTYQRRTCYQRHQMDARGLEWANQPSPYKIYPGIESVALPETQALPGGGLWPAATGQEPSQTGVELTLTRLAQVLDLGYGITAGRRHGGQLFYYRSPASAGALYPTELYLVANPVAGLDPGIYHYALGQRSLGVLRPGGVADVWPRLFGEPSQQSWAALLLITGRFFRSAWKYRTRGYRYVLLDCGHGVGSLGLALNNAGLPWELHTDFNDDAAAQLLGLDSALEAGLACIAIAAPPPESQGSHAPSEPGEPSPQSRPIPYPPAAPLCAHEDVDPEIRALYRAAAAPTARPPAEFDMARHLGFACTPGPSLTPAAMPPEALFCTQAMLQRRSKRNFVERALPRDTFNSLVALVRSHYCGLSMAGLFPPRLLSLSLLTGDVEGLNPGHYQLTCQEAALQTIRTGSDIAPMAAVCLNQAWLAGAAVHFIMAADLRVLDETCGPRGYRRALMQAGSLGQLIYVAATALGLGACGIGAYYDHEARELLGLPQDSFMLYLLAVGPVKK